MQLRKLNWKRLRGVKPCLGCGGDHETKTCLNRNGKRPPKLTPCEAPFSTVIRG